MGATDLHEQHDHNHGHGGHCVHREVNASITDYENHGIRFQFPSNWALAEQSTDEETTISVQSDGTSFWMLMLFKRRPDPEEVLETAVKAFVQDYEDVDVVSAVGSLCGLPSLGRELDFVCYDLVNSATIRVFQTGELTIMVLFQGTDHELKVTGTPLKAITASLRCDDDDNLEDVAPRG